MPLVLSLKRALWGVGFVAILFFAVHLSTRRKRKRAVIVQRIGANVYKTNMLQGWHGCFLQEMRYIYSHPHTMSMKPVICLMAFFTLPCAAMAQTVISVPDASARYHAKIIAKCESASFSGEAKIQLLEKERNRAVQTFTSEHFIVQLDSNWKEGDKKAGIAADQQPLVFDDFNFDGEEDVAIRNGSKGSHGSPSYDVYLYNAAKKAFVADKQLTKLASENLGMFETDRFRKQLTVYQKNGCCWNATITYGLQPGRGLTKMAEVVEEADAGGDVVTVTTSQLVNGKMKKNVKRYKTQEYYKDKEGR